MLDLATVIVYGLATLVGLYALLFVVPVLWYMGLDWCQKNLGPKRGPHVVDIDERRRQQLQRIADPRSAGRRL